MAATALETAPASITASGPPPGFRPYRLTIDRYHRMIAAGILTKRDRVFLWKGQIVEKMTKNPPHDNAVTELNVALVRLVPDGWHVRQEQPVVLSDNSEPEPDFTIIRGSIRDFRDRRRTTHDVALVIEVADTSLAFDSGEALESYARDVIPIYWLVNIPQRRIEVYQRPEGPRYAEHTFYGLDDEVPVVLDGRQIGAIPVRDILP